MRIAVLTLGIACALVVSARADVVLLKDGGSLEGKVVADDGKVVTLETRFGTQKIERSRIARIEKGMTALEELAQSEAALEKAGRTQPGIAQKWFELAEWAGTKSLKKERARLVDKTLALDPEHEGANLAKGRVKHDGRWMTPVERDALVSVAEEAAMRARGLVPYAGRWVTPEEQAHLERGDELVGGKWLAPDAAKRARGLVPIDGAQGLEWIQGSEEHALALARGFAQESKLPIVTTSGSCVVTASAFGREHSQALCDAGERGVAIGAKSLRESATDLAWLGGQKPLLLVVPAREEFGSFAHFFARRESKVDERWADGVSTVDGFYWWDPVCTSATCRGSRQVEDTTAHTIHHLGHLLLNRHAYNFKFLPVWLDEGYAAWLEHAVLGRNFISCISSHRYSHDGVRKDELLARTTWFEDALDQITLGKDPPLWGILRKDLATITPDEVSKSMVVIDYLIGRRPDDFAKMFTALRKAWPAGIPGPISPEAIAAHEKAFEALGTPIVKLDQEIRRVLAVPIKPGKPGPKSEK